MLIKPAQQKNNFLWRSLTPRRQPSRGRSSSAPSSEVILATADAACAVPAGRRSRRWRLPARPVPFCLPLRRASLRRVVAVPRVRPLGPIIRVSLIPPHVLALTVIARTVPIIVRVAVIPIILALAVIPRTVPIIVRVAVIPIGTIT